MKKLVAHVAPILLSPFVISSTLLFSSTYPVSTQAQNYNTDYGYDYDYYYDNYYRLSEQYGQQVSENTKNLAEYLINFASYFGYNISQPSPQSPPSATLLGNVTALTSMMQNVVPVMLGAASIYALNGTMAQFVDPNAVSSGAAINNLANKALASYPFLTNLIDQYPYQNDPVNQSILNILGTPDYSFCMTNAQDQKDVTWINNCSNLYQTKVMNQVLGMSQGDNGGNNIINTNIPGPYYFFNYEYNSKFLTQLNSNSLLGPLMYSSQSFNSSNNNANQTPAGLSAQNEIQQASNFIQYVTGAVSPLSLMDRSTYNTKYIAAVFPGSDLVGQMQAQTSLLSYLMSLRVYAAQSSVGFSNIYWIFSRRMPQSVEGGTTTSDALNEFQMATRRINNFTSGTNQWITQINTASSATVQKEMAILLAEINYQLYLNRQLEERLLLTNSILLLQNAKTAAQTSGSGS